MSIINDLKSVGKTLNDIGKIDDYKKILNSWEKIMEMQKEIQKLKEENTNLKDKIKIKDSLIKDGFVYFLEKNKIKEGPYCSRCWEKDLNLLTLQKNRVGPWNFICPECNSKIEYE